MHLEIWQIGVLVTGSLVTLAVGLHWLFYLPLAVKNTFQWLKDAKTYSFKGQE